MRELKWRPVTQEQKCDPNFRAFGREDNGPMFYFWNGGGDWMQQTNDPVEGEGYDEDICFPDEYVTMLDILQLTITQERYE